MTEGRPAATEMVDEDRCCIDIVTQISEKAGLSAARGKLRITSHCAEHAITSGNKYHRVKIAN
jgi:DNA-binding FrmR family transcriptional regulator